MSWKKGSNKGAGSFGGKGAWSDFSFGWQGSDEWETPGYSWGEGKGKKKQWQQPSKGKGKGAKEGLDEYLEDPSEWTSRIKANFQFNKKMLRASISENGGAFVSDWGGDADTLSWDSVIGILSTQDSHLLRRPGVGVSEVAGSVRHSKDVLKMATEDPSSVGFAKMFERIAAGGEDLMEALSVIDSKGPSDKDRSFGNLKKSLEKVVEWVNEDQNLYDYVRDSAIASARIYLQSMQLLQLTVVASDSVAWAERVPFRTSESPEFTNWKQSGRADLLAPALARLIVEELATRAKGSKAKGNSAAATFGSSSSKGKGKTSVQADEEDKKKKKDKKPAKSSSSSTSDKKRKKKDKKKPKKKRSSSSSSSSKSKKAKKAKKASKEQKPDNTTTAVSESEAKSAAFTLMKQGALQELESGAKEMLAKIGNLPDGKFRAADLKTLVADVPAQIFEVVGLRELVTKVEVDTNDEGMASNTMAQEFVNHVVSACEEMNHFFASPGKGSGS